MQSGHLDHKQLKRLTSSLLTLLFLNTHTHTHKLSPSLSYTFPLSYIYIYIYIYRYPFFFALPPLSHTFPPSLSPSLFYTNTHLYTFFISLSTHKLSLHTQKNFLYEHAPPMALLITHTSLMMCMAQLTTTFQKNVATNIVNGKTNTTPNELNFYKYIPFS